jgi:glutamine synthetase
VIAPVLGIDDLRHRFVTADIKRVKVGAFDMDTILRGKYISLEKFWSALEHGMSFCDVIFGWDLNDALLDNLKFTGWHTGYPDARCIIDRSTFRVIPWEPETAFFLLDLVDKKSEPLAISPRQVLRSVLKTAEERGFHAYFGAEYEFWLFKESPESIRSKGYRGLTPLSPGSFGYSVLRASANSELVIDLLESLNGFDIPIEGFHTETGPGVYEAAIAVDVGMCAADKAALFKTAVKEIAAKYSVMATFMAKWNSDLPGSSGHIHQSLWRGDDNVLFDETARRSYIGGLMQYLPELMPMICPTINSYKRLVPGTWAPVSATWGIDSRTTAVRDIPGDQDSSRIELRLSGADMNPYLAMAASLAAGLEGLELNLTPLDPVIDAYNATGSTPLPRSLKEAVQAFHTSSMARRWFGDAFVDHYASTRAWEVRQYEKAVTDWELSRYFESI